MILQRHLYYEPLFFLSLQKSLIEREREKKKKKKKKKKIIGENFKKCGLLEMI